MNMEIIEKNRSGDLHTIPNLEGTLQISIAEKVLEVTTLVIIE